MELDIRDLLGSVPMLQSPGVRIGLPDDPTPVHISDPGLLAAHLDDALRAFHELRPLSKYLVDASINTIHGSLWTRFVKPGASGHRGVVEPTLAPLFDSLREVVAHNHGDFHYWGGNNYFDANLPFRGLMREDFPDVKDLPWEQRYRYLLERESWESLRGRVFRFSRFAVSIASQCIERQMSRILIPSVGLCIDPWLFADRGLSVIATESSGSALAAVSEPWEWPRLYSRSAFERWDIHQAGIYACDPQPDHFPGIPDLEDRGVRESLKQRIEFELADWAKLPINDRSIDAIFATNALPRDSEKELASVLREWVRVIRPGGIAFVLQHNFFKSDVEATLQDAGWVRKNILKGECPDQPDRTSYQVFRSSG